MFVKTVPFIFLPVQKNGSLKIQDREDHIVKIDKKKKEMINVDSKTKPIDPQLVCSTI